MKQNKSRKQKIAATVSPVTLLERERRQLERYLFRFKRSAAGEASATTAFKLSRAQMGQSGVMDGWSIKDVLAWLVSWEQGLLAWLRAPSRRPPTANEKEDLLDTETFRRLRRRPLDEVVEESKKSFAAVMRALGDHSGVGADIVALNLASRYGRARTRIREWLKAQQATIEQRGDTTTRGRRSTGESRSRVPAFPRSRTTKHRPPRH